MSSKYTIGIDFGTESGRAVLVEVATGKEVSTHVTPYKHKVLVDNLPTGEKLGNEWALQHPNDYLDVLFTSVPEVIKLSGVCPEDIIGMGVDFTSCTLIPLNQNFEPLCLEEEWKHRPHSWVKLWKHHAAYKEAEEINRLAKNLDEPFLLKYGGMISSEWMFPKILQVLKEDYEVYEKTELFIEACDWITYKLTDVLSRSSCTTGYKALWNDKTGYPNANFLTMIDHRFHNILETKLRGDILPIGEKAGELVENMAIKMGLKPGIPVAVGMIDAHAAVPAVGAVKTGQLVMAMGTSTCHMYLSDKEKVVKGISGVVKDGIVPGLYGYEAGQAAVGDIFGWFIDSFVAESLMKQAKAENITSHSLLEGKAAALIPGQSGLIALDWWNGNRSILVNSNLSGGILGLTLSTRPEEIYRALLEATAFGTRKIIETYESAGLEIKTIFACGGLPQVNQLLMQIYADVTNREITIADTIHTPALGSAMYGAVVAGSDKGGYASIFEAAKFMAKVKETKIKPIAENVEIYNQLYEQYLILHDYFGIEKLEVMNKLKQIKMGNKELVI